jgi:hypothetical protein
MIDFAHKREALDRHRRRYDSTMRGWVVVAPFIIIAACSTAQVTNAPAGGDGTGSSASSSGSASSPSDEGGTSSSGSTDQDAATTPNDATAPAADSGDGSFVRNACTSTFGSGLSAGTHGRLDGRLVSIVQPGAHGCNADSGHVHLQIEMNGDVYDVAVNVDIVDIAEKDMALTPELGGPWSEGWHAPTDLDYPTNLGLHSGDFTEDDQATATKKVNDVLATANHVSIFATKYGTDGVHLVHRNGNGNDGALIINPLSSTPHWVVFHFPTTQSF